MNIERESRVIRTEPFPYNYRRRYIMPEVARDSPNDATLTRRKSPEEKIPRNSDQRQYYTLIQMFTDGVILATLRTLLQEDEIEPIMLTVMEKEKTSKLLTDVIREFDAGQSIVPGHNSAAYKKLQRLSKSLSRNHLEDLQSLAALYLDRLFISPTKNEEEKPEWTTSRLRKNLFKFAEHIFHYEVFPNEIKVINESFEEEEALYLETFKKHSGDILSNPRTLKGELGQVDAKVKFLTIYKTLLSAKLTQQQMNTCSLHIANILLEVNPLIYAMAHKQKYVCTEIPHMFSQYAGAFQESHQLAQNNIKPKELDATAAEAEELKYEGLDDRHVVQDVATYFVLSFLMGEPKGVIPYTFVSPGEWVTYADILASNPEAFEKFPKSSLDPNDTNFVLAWAQEHEFTEEAFDAIELMDIPPENKRAHVWHDVTWNDYKHIRELGRRERDTSSFFPDYVRDILISTTTPEEMEASINEGHAYEQYVIFTDCLMTYVPMTDRNDPPLWRKRVVRDSMEDPEIMLKVNAEFDLQIRDFWLYTQELDVKKLLVAKQWSDAYQLLLSKEAGLTQLAGRKGLQSLRLSENSKGHLRQRIQERQRNRKRLNADIAQLKNRNLKSHRELTRQSDTLQEYEEANTWLQERVSILEETLESITQRQESSDAHAAPENPEPIMAEGLVIGGHQNLHNGLRPMLPNFRFISAENLGFDERVMSRHARIYFCSMYAGHKLYYKVRTNLKAGQQLVYIPSSASSAFDIIREAER